MTSKYAGADWLESEGVVMSPLGRKVADLIGDLFQGIYHLGNEITNANWNGIYLIEVNIRKNLATYDSDVLTWLVFMCHDRCIRCELAQSGPGRIKLRFHPRKGRLGSSSTTHPTIEEALELYRSHFPKEAE